MASIVSVNEDAGRLHKLICQFWDDHAYVLDADFADAVELVAEIKEIAAQLEKDYTALEAALVKTRG